MGINQGQAIIHVYMPPTHIVMCMNIQDFSSIIAFELGKIYMELFNLEARHMPKIRSRYGIGNELSTAYDDA